MASMKDQIFGDYDFKALCMPMLPWQSQERTMQFFSRNNPTPYFVACLMGLQHAFAMVGGLVVPPYVVMKFSVAFGDVELQQYAIACSLIISGLCTILNCVQVPIPGTKYVLGTGVLSVIGTSFTFLPIFESAIALMKEDGEKPIDAYGKMLGTVLVCSLLEVFLSFIPYKMLKKVFPPIVTGVAVTLIGVNLTGTGMKYWGGGAVCADMNWKNHNSVADLIGFGPLMTDFPMAMTESGEQCNATAGAMSSGHMKIPPIPGIVCGKGSRTCCEAGDVFLPFGSPELVGLGFSVFCGLVIIELFGSPFVKNCNVIFALLFGYFVAGLSEYCPEGGGSCKNYITDTKINLAKEGTFLWDFPESWSEFKIGIYGPAIFPCLIAFIVTTVETIGDIMATYEASDINIEEEEEEFGKSIQGGLLSDGVCSFFAAIGTGMPNTTFSQNNGVISMTKCASRRAGIACGMWLTAMGVLAKVSGLISSIPDCVMGGMTTFLFCGVLVSGINVLSSVNLTSRRNRLILIFSLGIGVGTAMTPYLFNDMRASPYSARFFPCSRDGKLDSGTECSLSEKGLRNGLMLFLGTPYCVGTVIAMLMNAILPQDMKIVSADGDGGKEGGKEAFAPEA